MKNVEIFESHLNSKVSANFIGVPFRKVGKIMKYCVVVWPHTGFHSPISRFFKTYEAAQKFAKKINN